MNFEITPKRTLFGVGLSVLFILIALGNFSNHKWTAAIAVLAAGAGTILAFGVAFSARVSPFVSEDGAAPVSAGRQFRNSVVLWVVVVIALLVTVKVLDLLHAPWQQWIH